MPKTSSPLRLAKNGNRPAFEVLLGPFIEQGYRLAYSMLLDRQSAEDAVQEAAVKAWLHLDRLRDEADLEPWFFAIVANQCRSARRARWWSVLKGIDVQPATIELDNLTARVDLRQAMLALKPDDRALLVLHYYHGLTLERTAQTLRISSGAAKSRLHRCLKRLRTQIEVAEVHT
jgi:RNA polymerase sigma-70 factor, ECF subfamily